MKAKLIHEMTNDELAKKLGDLKKEYFNLRLSHATGQLSNPKALTVCKKDIAKVQTIIRERELGISSGVK
ncbi:MAG: 50S ribosomal protein L29 [Clostridia bacterium]|nr:50S ribosomal protein L29 [Clostridia bacterium]